MCIDKKTDCAKALTKEIKHPEVFFLNNFVSISSLDDCLKLAFKGIKNRVGDIDENDYE